MSAGGDWFTRHCDCDLDGRATAEWLVDFIQWLSDFERDEAKWKLAYWQMSNECAHIILTATSNSFDQTLAFAECAGFSPRKMRID